MGSPLTTIGADTLASLPSQRLLYKKFDMNNEHWANHNDDLLKIINQLPTLDEGVKTAARFLFRRLNEREVRADGLQFIKSTSVCVKLPLVGTLCDQDWIGVNLWSESYDNNLPYVGVGPSSVNATEDNIEEYLEWLDRDLMKRGMSHREMLESG